MNGLPLARDILSRPAQAILLGSFGITLVLAIRRGEGLGTAFERYGIGFLAILFYSSALRGLFAIGGELDNFLAQLGDRDGLKEFVAKALYESSTAFKGHGAAAAAMNMGSYLLQVMRTGVWGVCASLTELIFLLARFLLEVSRDALWQILFILFPLGAGFYPLFPRVLAGMCVLALELVLWLPVLTIVNVATSLLALEYSKVQYDIGFYVLACEIVAILLTLSIPSIVHKMVSGCLSGESLNSWSKTLAMAAIIATKGKAATSSGSKLLKSSYAYAKKRGKAVAIVAGLSLVAESAEATDTVALPFGYVTKLTCRGRLLVSAIGDERLLDLSALPKEIGCGVLLRPKVSLGRTNLILETTGGTIHRMLTISKESSGNTEIELEK